MTESSGTISKKTGLPPGTLVHVGEVLETKTRISVVDYNKDAYEEKVLESIEEIVHYKATDTVTWINIEGLVNTSLVESIGKHFNIHPLVLEDILNTHQRPKFEEYEGYLYLVLKGMYVARDNVAVDYEQISILVLNGFVFTFKEKRDELFNPIKVRLKTSKGRIRGLGTDYLAYAILDTVVDQYLSLQDLLDEIVESIEDELLTKPTSGTLSSIMRIKHELIFIRKSATPLREMLHDLLRCESALIQDETLIYYRDVYDHILRLNEAIETYRDMVTGLLDIYHSNVSNKMNEIMKVLTVFASIFIPLTFLTGIYGMNFKYMPELEWKWAYSVLWVLFIVIPAILVVYFKKKKWI